MLQPKRTKHRKAQKGRIKGDAKRGATLAFGTFGLKSLEPKWITNRQIEAARQAMTRHMKREGNVWIRIFPDKPITNKPAEVRMGKGEPPEIFVLRSCCASRKNHVRNFRCNARSGKRCLGIGCSKITRGN